jgi:hypothetical protein
MSSCVEGLDRTQVMLMPECLDYFIARDNPTRVVDAFVEERDLQELEIVGATLVASGRRPPVSQRSIACADSCALEPKDGDGLQQLLCLGMQALCRSGALFDERRVLLRCLIHLRNRLANLCHARVLL